MSAGLLSHRQVARHLIASRTSENGTASPPDWGVVALCRVDRLPTGRYQKINDALLPEEQLFNARSNTLSIDTRSAEGAHNVSDAQAQQTTVERIVRAISSRRFRFSNEKDLQAGIETAFREDGLIFEREVRLAPGDVVDFMVGGVAVEVKTDGPLAALTRQIDRYAEHERVRELVVISSRRRLTNLPQVLRGKNVHGVALAGGLL